MNELKFSGTGYFKVYTDDLEEAKDELMDELMYLLDRYGIEFTIEDAELN